jgi:hypothetical protein
MQLQEICSVRKVNREIVMAKGRTKFAEELSDLLIALNGFAHDH